MADIPPRNPNRTRWHWTKPKSVEGRKRNPRCSYCGTKVQGEKRIAYKVGGKKVACEGCAGTHNLGPT